VVRGLPALLVEAFSEEPLGGNGAAVVRLADPAPAPWMGRVAARLRQSETAFLLAVEGAWALRWFTPTQEVPLCGHGTLAALLALGHWNLLAEDQSGFGTPPWAIKWPLCLRPRPWPTFKGWRSRSPVKPGGVWC